MKPVLTIPRRIRPLLERVGRIAQRSHAAVYAVGGCVRDWSLGIANTTDLDVAVEGDGIGIARAAAALGGRVTVHPQFGTATILLHRSALRIDFATCRQERYTSPAAYPRVTFARLREDLVRRDFTINAMAVALHPARFGELVDPFQGARDLAGKRLRVLHERSFLDDPSRILRGVRFAQRFGFHWERGTAQALRAAIARGALGWLNAGRLHRELERMAEEPNPSACFEHLATLLERALKDA